jgi:hypothetical protein
MTWGSRSLWRGAAAAAALWGVGMLLVHAHAHVRVWAGVLGVWVLLGAAVLAMRGVGEAVLGAALGEWEEGFLLKTLAAVGVGMGALSLLMFFLGLACLYNPWTAYGALVVALAATAGRTRRFVRAVWEQGGAWIRSLSAAEAALCLALAGVLLVPVVLAFVPPTFYDTLALNLGLSNRCALAGGLSTYPYNHHTFLPQNTEMLITFFLLLFPSYELAQAWNVLAAAFSAAAVYALARLWLPRAWSFVASLLYLTTPAVLGLGSILKNDTTIAFACVLSLALAERGLTERRFALLALSGAFAGWAMGAKYSAVVFGASLGVAVALGAGRRRRSLGAGVKAAAIFGTVAVLVASPWYVRNVVCTGNPVYPAFGHVFPMPPFAGTQYERDVLSARRVSEFFLLPWQLTMESRRYGHFGEPGAFYLAAVPLVLLAAARMRPLRWLLAWSALMYVLWAATLVWLRLLFPALAVWAVAAVWGMRRAGEGRSWLRRALGGLAGWCVAANLFSFAVYHHALMEPAVPLFGAPHEREEWLARHVPYHPAAQCANERLAPSDKILLVGETRTYYLRVPYESDTAYDRTAIVEYAAEADSAETLARVLREKGFTHLLIHAQEIERLHRQYGYMTFHEGGHAEAFQALLAQCAPVCSENGVELLQLP